MIENILISYAFVFILCGFGAVLAHFLIPFEKYSIIALILGISVSSLGLYYSGKEQERSVWGKKMHDAELQIAQLEKRQQQISTVIVTEYKDRIQYIDRVKHQVVTEYVTKVAVDQCKLTQGFVDLHDSVALGEVPYSQENLDRITTVSIADVAETVKQNYATYHRTAAQLEALQSWLNQQKLLWDEK